MTKTEIKMEAEVKNGVNGNGNGSSDNGLSVETKELYTKATFPGRLVMFGAGSIGQCILPMLLRHTDITPDRMCIIANNSGGPSVAELYGIAFTEETITPENYSTILKKYLKKGDF